MSQVSREFDGVCAVLAFYGFDHTSVKTEAFFSRMVEWFESLGHSPSELGFTIGEKTTKLSEFPASSRRLRGLGFDEVSTFEMYSPTPGRDATCTDFRLSAGYDGTDDDCHLFVAWNAEIASLEDSNVPPLVRGLLTMIRPAYGIGFTRANKLGPTLYVTGVLMDTDLHADAGEEYEDNLTICRWGDIAMPEQVYRQGIIRDVYPYNYLNNAQLQRKVSGVTLEQWIRQSPRRGTLQRLTDEVREWRVEVEEIACIHDTLFSAGIIFDWHKYI